MAEKLRVLRPLRGAGGWFVVPIHYSHDPEKDDRWAALMRAGYLSDNDWAREMELDFTRAAAPMAYWNFSRQLHVRGDLHYNVNLPLCLCCDFNVEKMVWEVGQVIQGRPQVIAEIVGEPGIVPQMVQQFRNAYPAHPGGVWVYGDAAGNARSTHDARSDYDLMRLAFRNYASPVEWRVPAANPAVRDRINSVNTRLKSEDGEVGLYISEECKELLQDFEEVERDPKTGDVKKSSDNRDPYSMRTHSSDAVGYWIMREWPIVRVAQGLEDKKRRPQPDYSRAALPGDVVV